MISFAQRFVFNALLLSLTVFLRLDTLAEQVSVESMLDSKTTWNFSSEDFVSAFSELNFVFLNNGKTAKSTSQKISFMGFRVWESRFIFSRNQLSRIELSIYNKGDAGKLTKEAFLKKIKQLCQHFQSLTGSRGITGKVSKKRANYYINRRIWKYRDTSVLIEWGFVKDHRSNRKARPFRAEFIKAILTPLNTGSISGRNTGHPDWAKRVSGRILKNNVEKNSSGDICVTGIPMVDQGQKGYCAAASAERVLRYYGWQGDQHEIAQLSDTAAGGGTSLEGMVEAVAVVGKRYQLTDKTLFDPGDSRSFEKSEFFKMIELYNREAKASDTDEIDYMNFCDVLPDNVQMINTMNIFNAMDADILKRARLRQKQDFNRFQQDILNYVTQGVPLFWACIVGKYPETPDIGRKGAFGHIRLIIGMNERKKEVIYSDSWGAGHVLKRMPVEDAWAMTFGLTVLKPRDVR
ncbi:MAG: hypothetical protein R6V06_02670 [Kiritimatiellia bacterium]